MRRLIGFISLFVFLAGGLMAQSPDHNFFLERDTLDVSEAQDHLGGAANFCDEVQWLSKIEDHEYKPTLIKLGDANPGITVVIWEADAEKLFDKPLPELFKTGTKVCVTGQIKDFKGSPRMEIAFTEQVRFVE